MNARRALSAKLSTHKMKRIEAQRLHECSRVQHAERRFWCVRSHAMWVSAMPDYNERSALRSTNSLLSFLSCRAHLCISSGRSYTLPILFTYNVNGRESKFARSQMNERENKWTNERDGMPKKPVATRKRFMPFSSIEIRVCITSIFVLFLFIFCTIVAIVDLSKYAKTFHSINIFFIIIIMNTIFIFGHFFLLPFFCLFVVILRRQKWIN